MGSQQQYCLRWNNHQSNILSVFDSLFQNEAMVDVTLACEGLSIKAHKMVLSACSPYFQSLFMENPCKHPIVILKDVSFADLKALMDFMYRGEVNVNQEQLDSLLKTAETLKVRGLTEVATNAGDLQNSMLNQEREVTHLPPHHLAGIAPPQPSTHPTLVHTLNRSSPSPKRRKKMPDQQKANPSPSPSELEDSDNVIEPKIEIKESQQSNELMSKIIQAALVQTGSAAGGAFQSSLVHSDQAPSGAFQSNGSQGLPSANDASPSVDQNFTVRPNEAVPQLLYKSSLCQPPGMQGDKVFVVRPLDGDHLTPEVDNTSSFKKQKGRPTILYEEEEDEIVDFIARNAYEGTPVDSKKILEYGNLLLRREGRRPTGNMYCDPVKGLSVKWWRGFKKRHPGLPYMRLK